MVNIRQIVFSILSTYLPIQLFNPASTNPTYEPKSIAIVGAGSGGLAMLKTILDLPEETRERLQFVLYDERDDVGGVWLPDPRTVLPPEIPLTPLYPLLHTNTPIPSMSYPGFPFMPGTPLYPSHEHIQAYHRRYATHFKLLPYIRFQHRVLQSHWVGTSSKGWWNITIRDAEGEIQQQAFDHLIIATGNNHFPRIPIWPGEDEWLESSSNYGPRREILHSIYYREPERYLNRSVLIVGNGASGRDAAIQVGPIARKTYVSVRHDAEIPEHVEVKPEISHFTADGVVFRDGSLVQVDSVLLGTGYELRKPFLDEGRAITTDPSAHSNSSATDGLVTNLRYIFPLHKHILSLCPSYPTNALAFLGLPTVIANCPSDIAQSLFALHAILHPEIFPSREELLKELAAYEQHVRQEGFDPYVIGHRQLNGTSSDYQDDLVDFLKRKNAIPDDGKKFVEGWRRDIFDYVYLKRGWQRIESLGTGKEWVKDVKTEEEWADLMRRVNAWQKNWEDEHNVPFSHELDLAG
ncbi:hypothetical protein BDQ12DRAFT_626589 [Crucibulum laeve]|uniref:FAD/NAD(P)-binding domain-containing protein n=1 Tax=Crucibulum laeve TaxID=68775 RepID=A0A5C3M7E1_9AGAR|nr:hypothetical protein BDQ12DRAFT_626589 [Crucibulum laeve]